MPTNYGNKNYSVQEAVNPGCAPQAYGAASLYGVRAIHSNVDRAFKCTFYDGTTVKLKLLAGLVYPYAVRNVALSNASAISSASVLVLAIR